MEYSENSIKHLAKLDHIRKRPTGYIVDTGVNGQFHIVKEILDNSIDELVNYPNDSYLKVFMFRDMQKGTYQIAVVDNGRGIPVKSLIDVFTNPNTSGKFDTNSYKFSAGTFGVGAKATAALSDKFRAVTFKQGKIGSIFIRYDNIPKRVGIGDFDKDRHGVVVVFEPDQDIFVDVEQFMTNGYETIVDFLSKSALFAKYRIQFKLINTPLPVDIKTVQAKRLVSIMDAIEGPYDFDSVTFDKDAYVKKFFRVMKQFDWNMSLYIDEASLKVEMKFMSTILNNANNNKLTFVNGVPFTDGNNAHIKMTLDYLKELISVKLDARTKKFFLKIYKLPVWLLMDVKFEGAQFSGTTKHLFQDVKFKSTYNRSLRRSSMPEVADSLYEFIREHIETSFLQYSKRGLESNTDNFTIRLNRPDKFFDCNTKDRSQAELFLIEGDSAKSDQGRDSELQGSYLLSGKPMNSVTTPAKKNDSIDKLKANKIYQDIIMIIGITPGSNDLSNLNFGKIFIATDADVHGYHIANIILSNLFTLCPALIENGHVYIVIPPLYGITMKNSKTTYYVKDQAEYISVMAYHVYYRLIDVHLESQAYKLTQLPREEFVAFAEIVMTIGETITNLSVEFSIPAVILEQLALIPQLLTPAMRDQGVEKLRELFDCNIRYTQGSDVIVMELGARDIIIPLNSINELIYSKILPMFKVFEYSRLKLYVSTKLTDSHNKTPCSIVQLYEMFKEMDGICSIKRFKGLGAMSPKDRSITCIDKTTRRTYQITSIGDIDVVYGTMGNDANYRKRLINEQSQ